ncbi:AraC family transcriptional regulator [Nocardia sp. NPDC055321]
MRTREADPAVALVKSLVIDHRARVAVTAPERLHVSVSSVTAAGLGSDLLRFSGISYHAEGEPSAELLAAVLLSGSGTLSAAGTDLVLAPRDMFLAPMESGWATDLQDMVYALVRFPPAEVAEHAADLCGPADRPLRFHSLSPVPGTERFWADTCAYLYRQLVSSGIDEINTLVLHGLKRLTATALLASFPNTTMTASYTPGPGPTPSATVWRAARFIDDHAAEPLTLERIAAEARVTPRALQAGFRRHFDTTPLGYLRRVRLEHAHRDLRAADPTLGATVETIAARWGFPHPSRFAAQYKRAFGVLPSHTLRS